MTTRPPSDDEQASDESLLRRWSRRKQAAREGQAAAEDAEGAPATESPVEPQHPPAEDAPAAGPTEAAHDATEADDAPTDADMPPLESLDEDSDYSQFMSPRVSDTLRRMALRKLFGMSGFNIRDGLDDYDEDFTRYQSLGDTVTADMKYHAERRARQAEDERTRTAAANDGDVTPPERSDADAGSEADASETGTRDDNQPPRESGDDGHEGTTDELG